MDRTYSRHMMDERLQRTGAEALRAYVVGDTSEPVVISAFHHVPFEERTWLIDRHRPELAAIDDARLTILESMLLPLDDRRH